MKCELCGTEVKIVGKTTKHYEPIDSPEVTALVEALKEIEDSIVNPFSMTDAKMQLGMIERKCHETLAIFQKSRGKT